MKKLLGDTVVMSAAELLNRCKGIVFIPVIVSAVGLDGYAAFVQVFITAKLIASFARLEVGMGFERYAASLAGDEGARGELSRHFWSVLLPALALALLGALALLAGAGWLSATFFEGGHRASLEFAALIVLSNTIFSVARSFLIGRRRFKGQSGLSLGYNLLPYLAFVGAAAATRDVHSGIVAYTVLDLAAALVVLAQAMRGLSWARPDPRLFGRYLRYSAPLAISVIEGGLLDKADRFFISALLGLEALAVYNIVYRCTELVGFVSIPLRTQLLSHLAAAWDGGRVAESKAMVRGTVLAFLGLTTGLLLCLALYFDALLPIFGKQPIQVPHLRWIVLAIGMGMLANALKRFYYLFIRLDGKTHHETLNQLVGVVVNVAGNALLIPPLGLLGAALATLVSYAVMIPVVSRRHPLDLDRAFVGHVLSFVGVAAAVAPLRWLIPPEGVPAFLLSSGAAFGAYLGILYLWKRRLLGELRRGLVAWQPLA